jgi:signal transduction histidine kinase/ligand-binding sensor domain-containing protein
MKIFYSAGSMVWLFILCTAWKTHAQMEKLRFEHININNGLSHNDVMEIRQDSKGYIWMGTLDGLNKYDGYQFTTYQREPHNTASLTMNAISGIWEDVDGTFWIHPVNSDLNKFNPSTESFSIANPLPGKNFQFDPRQLEELEVDKEGMIWLYNDKGQLFRFDRANNRLYDEDYSSQILNNPYNSSGVGKSINDIFRDKSGELWFGTSEGLHKLNLTPDKSGQASRISFIHYWRNRTDTNSFLPVIKILEDHAGKFWGSNSQVLTSFDPQTKKIVLYKYQENNINSISDNRIRGIAEDQQGNLWIATQNGLNRLDKDRNRFTRYYHDADNLESLSGNIIMTLIIDKSNTLWIGTLQSGISKVNLNYHSFPLYQHNPFDANSLSNNKVTAICEDKEAIVWIGTLDGGLNAWNRNTGKFIHYKHNQSDPASLFSGTIGSVFEDAAGNLWIAGGRSKTIILSRLNRGTGKFDHHLLEYPSINNPFAGPVFTIYLDKAGLFWIGTVNGVVTFEPFTKQSHHYPYDQNQPDGISDPWIFSFCEDEQGNIWMGTSTERLNKLNRKTGKYTHYAYDPKKPGSISSSTVRCIYKDSKGTLWFGTFGGGLCRFNPENETFTAFTIKQGLPGNTIHSIQEDDEGNLWLATGNGLSKFSITSNIFTNYDINDGLQSNQFTVGHSTPGASYKGRDGTLYFGGIKGLNVFHPKHLQRNQYIPPVVINQFKLFDKPVPGKQIAKQIELKHDQNFFSFEFAALDYTNSQKNHYAYKLEGVDKDWVQSGTRRYASYTGVAPGKYIFRVKGTNSDGIWNEKDTSISVIIHPPWWRTGWAYAFYALCFLVGVFAIHKFQRQRLIRIERERGRDKELKQAKEIEKAYHELKTTQQQLIQSEKMASLGELTAGIAHEIQNPLNFVNNFSEVNKELVDELQQELKVGKIDDAIAISNDIKENEEKINHHGKRADAIVKGMLQHSRSSSGVKEPTDINALADEYLRLAYHGLRAKDKSFNAKFETDFDPSIEKINVVPQDIGRVLLNLINNAFYAVSEKQKKNIPGYEPTVTVKTSLNPPSGGRGAKVELRVKDNGNGIPQKVVDKIFQPFFTTKPTGQGTGLGLSLAYDIVKAHGGELKLETKEENGSEFIIQLPL